MVIMETREKLEDISTEEEAKKIRKENFINIEDKIKEISEAFNQSDLEKAKKCTIELQYLNRIDDALETWSNTNKIFF
ncbi:hypothetical protein AYI70_g3886 [Smittium culicis]|uniref:Co-chaperone HscB C-terminal oligomerisation domain-containing protein n=1 Tax=Smittium culicis TaxID=133412 RepID=A0A1R1Y1K3_9FUNG|nr:hypothetical protein AYI70_g3886 [Smittium culicis]